MLDVPKTALSVRQPWAWAIIHGGKDVENRSWQSVHKGGMCAMQRIMIHAARGMTRDEYESAHRFMAGIGVDCPLPNELVRGAIIGAVTIEAVVKESDSPWFFGPRGLVLSNPAAVEPIPARGMLGYFTWERGGEIVEPLPWMVNWGTSPTPNRQPAGMPLFD